jgi:hypothetical protein
MFHIRNQANSCIVDKKLDRDPAISDCGNEIARKSRIGKITGDDLTASPVPPMEIGCQISHHLITTGR